MPYELLHWGEVYKCYNSANNFIEWLAVEHNIHLDFLHTDRYLSVPSLLDEFFEVDRIKLDDERRELLKNALNSKEDN